MKVYKLKNSRWYRGKGTEWSFLKDGIGPVCCLGNALEQEGMVIRSRTRTLGELVSFPQNFDLPKHLQALESTYHQSPKPGNTVSEVSMVYDMNDIDTVMPDEERVDKINKLTEPFGFKFEYVADE